MCYLVTCLCGKVNAWDVGLLTAHHGSCLGYRQQSIDHRWLLQGDWRECTSHMNVWPGFRKIDTEMSGYYESACFLFVVADFNRNTKRKLQDPLVVPSLCLLNPSCQVRSAAGPPATQHTSARPAPPFCFLCLPCSFSLSTLWFRLSVFPVNLCTCQFWYIHALMLWLEEDSCKLHPGSPNVLSKKGSYWLIVCWEDPFT